MKLLFVSNVYPGPLQPTKGPFNRALVTALAASHRVRVVNPVSWVERLQARWSGRPRATASTAVVKAPAPEVSHPTFYYPPMIQRSRFDRWLDWSLQREFPSIRDDFRPEAVLSYWVHPDGTTATRLAQALGVPSIVMTGGSDVLLLGRHGARRKVILNTLHAADAVVTVSLHLRDQLAADGIDPAKLHVVHRGIDRTVFHPGPRAQSRARLGLPVDRRTIVAVGRLVPVKGWDLLLDACRVLHQRGRKFGCAIVGGGDLHSRLTGRIAELGLEQVVTLAGARPQSELADWYRSADVVALTSLSEGIPNVLLEAMSCGTPWVATDVGGVREIADAQHHTLLTGRDPIDLANALEQRWEAGIVPPERLSFQPADWATSAARLSSIVEACRARRASHDSFSAPDGRALVAAGGATWE